MMAKTARLNTRITEALKERISRLAAKLERPEAWIVDKALTKYLDEAK